jgi:hypothetical protein
MDGKRENLFEAITNNQPKKEKENTMKTQCAEPIEALAIHLGINQEDIEKHKYGLHYGLPIFSIGSKEYAVGDDEQAGEALFEYIEQSVWAFRPSFIASECNLPESEGMIKAAQEKCEDANDGILAMIKGTCGLKSFVDSAESADGRGHFLSSYDGEENEVDGFFVYRLN